MDNQQDGLELIPIPFLDKYFCDKNGNIYSTRRGKIKKLKCYEHYGRSKRPYLRLKAAGKLYLTHRMIASVFKGRELYDGEFINHIDSNKLNNQLCNLEIVSHQENVKHAVENKLYDSGKEWYERRTSSTIISQESKAK